MITVSTTSEAEARGMADLLRAAPAWLDWRVYRMGTQVASSADPGQLHPARERMRQLLIDRGSRGYAPGLLWDRLCAEGLTVTRETLQRWLVADEKEHYVLRAAGQTGLSRWVWAGKAS